MTRWKHIFFLFLLVIAESVYAQSSKIISAIEAPTLRKEELELIVRSLGLETQKPYNSEKVSEGIRALVAKGAFLTIFVNAEETEKGLKIILSAEKVRKITKVEFENIDPEVKEQVQARMGIEAGTEEGVAIQQKSLPLLRERIKAGYDALGYYSSEVDFSYEEDAGQSRLLVKVNPGVATKVTKVKVTGGTSEENAAMLPLVSVSVGDRVTKAALDDSGLKINAYLQKNQYTTSRVEEISLDFSADKSTVEVNFIVRVRDRFQFLFVGNSVLDEVDLRALVSEDLLTQADSSEKIAALIEEKYKSLGYHFCKVRVRIQTTGEKQTTARFDIDEGEKVLVDGLNVRGNTADLSKSEVQSIFFDNAPGVLARKVYWEQGIDPATEALRKQLEERGFLNPSISSPRAVFTPDNKGVELFIEIELGNKTMVQKIELGGVKHFTQTQAYDYLGMKPGELFSRTRWQEGRRLLIAQYQAEGYSDAKYTPENEKELGISVSRDAREAVLSVEIQEGRRYTVGNVTVEGNRKSKEKIILREMKLTSGEFYDPAKVRRSEEDIQTLGLFSRVEILSTTNPTDPNKKDLKVIVRESPPGLGEVGFGGFYEDPRLRLRTFVGTSYRNLWGLNQTLSARTELALPLSSKGSFIPFVEYAGVLVYRSPYPFDIPLVFTGQLLFDSFEVSTDSNQITLQSRTRIEGRIEKKFSKAFTGIYRLYQLERTNTEVLDDESTRQIDLIGSTGPGAILDLRDDPYNPVSGSYHTLNIELASPLLLSQENISFYMVLSRNTFFVPIFKNWLNFSLFAGGGYAQSLFEGKGLPVARLANDLSLGGQGSIRGFSVRKFSPVPAKNDPRQIVERTAFYNGRAELSSPLFSNLSLAVFFDTGEVYPHLAGTGRHDGVGFGIRYKTPVGPIVVDLAQGLGPDREQVKFYFTFGTL